MKCLPTTCDQFMGEIFSQGTCNFSHFLALNDDLSSKVDDWINGRDKKIRLFNQRAGRHINVNWKIQGTLLLDERS